MSVRRQVSIGEMGALARQHNLPLYVDAAAERPDLPNYYLGEGATVVAYSGARTSIRWLVGCCLRVCRGLVRQQLCLRVSIQWLCHGSML